MAIIVIKKEEKEGRVSNSGGGCLKTIGIAFLLVPTQLLRDYLKTKVTVIDCHGPPKGKYLKMYFPAFSTLKAISSARF